MFPDNPTLSTLEILHGRRVGEVATSPAVTVTPYATVSEVVAAMDEAGIEHALVTYQGQLAGALCRSDLVDASPRAVAWRFATDVAPISASSDLGTALGRLVRDKLCCLPVFARDGWGIVTRDDLGSAVDDSSLLPTCQSCGQRHRVTARGFCEECLSILEPFPFHEDYVDIGTVD